MAPLHDCHSQMTTIPVKGQNRPLKILCHFGICYVHILETQSTTRWWVRSQRWGCLLLVCYHVIPSPLWTDKYTINEYVYPQLREFKCNTLRTLYLFYCYIVMYLIWHHKYPGWCTHILLVFNPYIIQGNLTGTGAIMLLQVKQTTTSVLYILNGIESYC